MKRERSPEPIEPAKVSPRGHDGKPTPIPVGLHVSTEPSPAATIGYALTDPQGRINWANRFLGIVLGTEPARLFGRLLVDLIAEKDRAAFQTELDRVVRTGECHECKIALRGTDDSLFGGVLIGAVASETDEKPIALRWIMRDVAKLDSGVKLAAAPGADGAPTAAFAPDVGHDATALRELIDAIDVAIVETGVDGRVRFVSRQVTEAFGHPEADWLAFPAFWDAIIHEEDRARVAAHHARCLTAAWDGELEYRIVSPRRRVHWVHESARVARDEAGKTKAIRCVLWKIGRRKRMERQLNDARQESAGQAADLVRFHELCRRLWTALEPDRLAEEIVHGATAILGATRGTTGLYDPRSDTIELTASVGLPVLYLEKYHQIPARNLSSRPPGERALPLIVEDTEADLTAAAFGDRARVGGFGAEATIPMLSRGADLIGAVTAYFDAPHRPSDHALRLIEIYARQAADAVEHVVRLPSWPAAPSAAGLGQQGSERLAAPRAGLRILVVDDEPEIARSIARLLATWGHDTNVANDGPSAIALAELHRPDIVLLDVPMPVVDGLELARLLRLAHGPSLKIVALAGFAADGNDRSLFDGCVVKPVSLEELRAVVTA